MTETVYRYTSYRPPETRMNADERPDHKFAYLKRRDTLVKGAKALAYRARCTCGWSHNRFTSYNNAHAVWDRRHMAEVEKQLSLNLQGERNA